MTSYGQYLSDLRACVNGACKFIIPMCNALKQEHPEYSNKEIRDKVMRDCLEAGLKESTITHNLPKEFKNPIKVAAGELGAEKKRIVAIKRTSGAADSAAEYSSEMELQPKDEDVEFLKKQLDKQIKENHENDIQIEQLRNDKDQLSEIIKKNSFIPAENYKPELIKKFEFPEPDDINTFVWKNITFDEFRMELGPLKASSNTRINVYLERVLG